LPPNHTGVAEQRQHPPSDWPPAQEFNDSEIYPPEK